MLCVRGITGARDAGYDDDDDKHGGHVVMTSHYVGLSSSSNYNGRGGGGVHQLSQQSTYKLMHLSYK